MSRRGWMLFAGMCLIWGIPYLMIKVAVEGGISVPVLVFTRVAVGVAVLLPLALRSGRLRGLVRYRWPLLAFAVIEIIIPWALLADAEQSITSSMTGLLIAASPIITVFVARAGGDRERLGAARWAGLAVGLGGVAWLAAPEARGGDPWAIAEVLGVAICYAIAPQIAARRLKDVPSLPMTAVCLGFAALVYLVPAILTWPDTMPSAEVLAALGGLALICTALAFLVFFALIREVGASRALVFTYVNPAVAVAAGVLFLDEPLTATIITSFVLILAGSVLATWRRAGGVPDTAAAATPLPEVTGGSSRP
ncbi:MAG: EamA family transporter [Streptosporangiales bacterium]|nr:EamA family transporter [Streptosporangiales bacterium]